MEESDSDEEQEAIGRTLEKDPSWQEYSCSTLPSVPEEMDAELKDLKPEKSVDEGKGGAPGVRQDVLSAGLEIEVPRAAQRGRIQAREQEAESPGTPTQAAPRGRLQTLAKATASLPPDPPSPPPQPPFLLQFGSVAQAPTYVTPAVDLTARPRHSSVKQIVVPEETPSHGPSEVAR